MDDQPLPDPSRRRRDAAVIPAQNRFSVRRDDIKREIKLINAFLGAVNRLPGERREIPASRRNRHLRHISGADGVFPDFRTCQRRHRPDAGFERRRFPGKRIGDEDPSLLHPRPDPGDMRLGNDLVAAVDHHLEAVHLAVLYPVVVDVEIRLADRLQLASPEVVIPRRVDFLNRRVDGRERLRERIAGQRRAAVNEHLRLFEIDIVSTHARKQGLVRKPPPAQRGIARIRLRQKDRFMHVEPGEKHAQRRAPRTGDIVAGTGQFAGAFITVKLRIALVPREEPHPLAGKLRERAPVTQQTIRDGLTEMHRRHEFDRRVGIGLTHRVEHRFAAFGLCVAPPVMPHCPQAAAVLSHIRINGRLFRREKHAAVPENSAQKNFENVPAFFEPIGHIQRAPPADAHRRRAIERDVVTHLHPARVGHREKVEINPATRLDAFRGGLAVPFENAPESALGRVFHVERGALAAVERKEIPVSGEVGQFPPRALRVRRF